MGAASTKIDPTQTTYLVGLDASRSASMDWYTFCTRRRRDVWVVDGFGWCVDPVNQSNAARLQCDAS